MPSLTVDAAVTDARSLELNALKTKSRAARAIYAKFRNIAQNLFCLYGISSLIIPGIFMQKHCAVLKILKIL